MRIFGLDAAVILRNFSIFPKFQEFVGLDNNSQCWNTSSTCATRLSTNSKWLRYKNTEMILTYKDGCNSGTRSNGTHVYINSFHCFYVRSRSGSHMLRYTLYRHLCIYETPRVMWNSGIVKFLQRFYLYFIPATSRTSDWQMSLVTSSNFVPLHYHCR